MLKRKSKRVLSIVLAVAMIVGLFPVAAFAEGGESATPVDQNTETVATKLPGADKTGVIKLTSNVMLKDTYTISQDTTVTIDLAGFKITNAEGKHTIVNNGNLTISDTSAEKNGTVDNISHARAALFNNPTGTVTLNGGTFDRSQENENSPDNSGNNSFYTIRNYGKMTINSGTTVRQKGHFSSMVTNGWYNVSNPSGQSEPIDTSSTPTLIINGGTFTGGLNTIKMMIRVSLLLMTATSAMLPSLLYKIIISQPLLVAHLLPHREKALLQKLTLLTTMAFPLRTTVEH